MYIYAYFLKVFTFPQNFCAEFFSFGLHASVPTWFPNGKQTNKQANNPAYFGEFGHRVDGVGREREIVMYIQSSRLKFSKECFKKATSGFKETTRFLVTLSKVSSLVHGLNTLVS